MRFPPFDAEVSFVAATRSTGSVDVESIVHAIRPNTCLVTVMLANNETGMIQPVKKICQAVEEVNKTRQGLCRILTHTDAAQAVGKIPVSVKDLGVDYLTVVGHKFYGPRIGALYAKDAGNKTPIYPLFYGGGQERNFRPGTENVAMIAGLGKAAQLVADQLNDYSLHMKKMRDYLKATLQAEFGDRVHFNNDFSNSLPNTCNVSFVGDGLEGFRVLNSCQQLEASVGAACHSHRRVSDVLLASGVEESLAKNAIRLSVGRETTREDIEVVVKELGEAVSSLVQSKQT